MSGRRIDFLRSRRTPSLGWLLLTAGALALGDAVRLEQRLDEARMLHDQAAAQLERDEELARQRQQIASRPTPESRRLAAATSETLRPWVPTFQAVEAATAPPVYVLDFTVNPVNGQVHLEGESPDFDQAVAYVERLGQAGAIVQAQLASHEQVTEASTARSVVKFTVNAAWSAVP